MGRPRTNLPWIERRGAQHPAYWRRPQGGKTYEAFTSRRDAESFRELVALVGPDTARAVVRRGRAHDRVACHSSAPV